jgi:hypothetical protein
LSTFVSFIPVTTLFFALMALRMWIQVAVFSRL